MGCFLGLCEYLEIMIINGRFMSFGVDSERFTDNGGLRLLSG
jgi:hypothetical protein